MKIKLKAEVLWSYNVLDKHWSFWLAGRKCNKEQPHQEAGKGKKQTHRLSGDIKKGVGEMLVPLHPRRSHLRVFDEGDDEDERTFIKYVISVLHRTCLPDLCTPLGILSLCGDPDTKAQRGQAICWKPHSCKWWNQASTRAYRLQTLRHT